MIELFGVGAHTETGAWLFRRVTAGFERGEVTFVMSSDRAARVGLLDVAAAASIATEGRVWITGAPVMRETRKAIARRVGNVRLDSPPAARTSVLSAVLPRDHWGLRRLFTRGRSVIERDVALATLERVGLGPCALDAVATLDAWRRRRLAIARALLPRPDHLICRDVDEGRSLSEAGDVLGVLCALARSERLPVLVSAVDWRLAPLYADRVLILSLGTLAFDGPPSLAVRARQPVEEVEVELARAS